MTEPRVLVVSNRLPVNISEKAGKFVLKRSVGGLATALNSVMDLYPMIWIGWPGTKKKLSKTQLLNMKFPEKLVPVAITAQQLRRYYDRLSNQILWPIMHGIEPARLNDIDADWRAMHQVTTRFADAIEDRVEPKDVIWVHDYHLVLLPDLLRKRKVSNRLGFFLHTPFPKPATLLEWPHHLQLLRSLSRVDVLGFQTKRDAKNFRACLASVGIRMRKGAVIKTFPIGIDYDSFRAASQVKKVGNYLNRFRKLLIGKKVVLSVSRLDYTKGIIEQLKAFEKVAESYKPSKLFYKLVVAPSRENVDEYKVLKDQITSVVNDINHRFKKNYGVKPIHFAYQSHGFEELNAWYRLADILLVTPRIDGMNLVVKEYIAAREAPGMIVLSNTIGAAFQLRDAVLVDPQDINDIAKGINQALKMTIIERAYRWKSMRNNVKKENIFWWTKQFLVDLYEKVEQQSLNAVQPAKFGTIEKKEQS